MRIVTKILSYLLTIVLVFALNFCSYQIDEKINYASTELEQTEESENKEESKEIETTNIIRKSRLEIIKERGYFIAGVRPNVRPFGFKKDDGTRSGFEVEMVENIAKRIGVEVRFVDVEFKETIPFTKQGKVDLVAAIITHKQQRDEDVDFSTTYFMDAERFLVRKDSGISSIDDLKKEGRKVATVQGDSFSENLKKKFPDIEIYYCEQYPQHYEALQSGLADAVGGDSTMLLSRRLSLFDNPDEYTLAGEPLSYAPFGMLLPENESDWEDAVNAAFNEMCKDGDYKKLYNKWFGPETDFDMSTLGWEPIVFP